MLLSITSIFVHVILPILLMIGVGALVNRHGRLNVGTLNRLSMYLLVPCFLFVKIYQSELSWSDIGEITYGTLLPVICLGLVLYLALSKRHDDGNTLAAILVGGLVFNAGNFGLPVAELYYEQHKAVFPGMKSPADGPAVQALIIMLSNISVWLLGYVVIALGKGKGIRGVLGFFRLPILYVVCAAFLFRETETTLPDFLFVPVRMLSEATVPVMLVTLGAQLAKDAHWPNWRLIGPAMVIKLLLLPAVTAAFVYFLGLWPWPGAQLIIASAAPTAVNTLLLSLELEGDAQTAADCVFWTTVAASITMTTVLVVVEHFAGI